MCWLSQVMLIILTVVGTQFKISHLQNLDGLHIAPAQSIDDVTANNFASTFSEGLFTCGAFNSVEASNYEEPMLILSRSVRSLPDVVEAHPLKIRELAEAFASGVASRMAANLSPGDIDRKIVCIIQSLNKALVPTTGVVNFYFISEVGKLIKSLYLSKNASSSLSQNDPNGGRMKAIPEIKDTDQEFVPILDVSHLGKGILGKGNNPSGNLKDGAPSRRKAAIVKRSIATEKLIAGATHGVVDAEAPAGEAANGNRPIPTEELIGDATQRSTDAAESLGEAVNGNRPIPTEELIGDATHGNMDAAEMVGEAVHGNRPVPTEELIGGATHNITDAAESVGKAGDGNTRIPTEELIGGATHRSTDAAELVGEAVKGNRPIPTEELIGGVTHIITDAATSIVKDV